MVRQVNEMIKRVLTVILCIFTMCMFSNICIAAEETATFETNLNWKSVCFAGNDFEVKENGLYTKQTTNAVFVRSDKFVDGTKSFTMEYEVDILSVVDDSFVQEQGWLFYTFCMGLPDEAEEEYTDTIKNQMLYYGGITILPYTREGVFVSASTEQLLPENLNGGIKHFTIRIEYASKFQEISYFMNDELLYVDFFNDENHEGYIGIETSWTEMLVTKAVYTDYPDGLPSEKVDPTEAPTETPTEVTTEAPTIEPTKKAEKTKAPEQDKEEASSSNSPLPWIIGAVAAVIIIVIIVILLLKKKKR